MNDMILSQRVEYLTQKMAKAEDMEKLILRKQITEIEKDIEAIR